MNIADRPNACVWLLMSLRSGGGGCQMCPAVSQRLSQTSEGRSPASAKCITGLHLPHEIMPAMHHLSRGDLPVAYANSDMTHCRRGLLSHWVTGRSCFRLSTQFDGRGITEVHMVHAFSQTRFHSPAGHWRPVWSRGVQQFITGSPRANASAPAVAGAYEALGKRILSE